MQNHGGFPPMRRDPFNPGNPPLQGGLPLPNYKSPIEPPPPGFEDAPPPGEILKPGMQRDDMHIRNSRDAENRPPTGQHIGPPPQMNLMNQRPPHMMHPHMPPMGGPPFNPNQPPPGFLGPPGMGPMPGMYRKYNIFSLSL